MIPGEHSKTDLRRGRIRREPSDREHATSAEEEAFLLGAAVEGEAADGKDGSDGKNAVVAEKAR